MKTNRISIYLLLNPNVTVKELHSFNTSFKLINVVLGRNGCVIIQVTAKSMSELVLYCIERSKVIDAVTESKDEMKHWTPKEDAIWDGAFKAEISAPQSPPMMISQQQRAPGF